MDSRRLTAAVGVVASLLVSILAWVVFDTLLLFVVVPFVPFLFRGGRDSGDEEPTGRHCPVCEYRTTDRRNEYCPRDGHRLE